MTEALPTILGQKEIANEKKVKLMRVDNLQKTANRLDKMMRNYAGITLRYQEIGKILEEVDKKFADESIFSNPTQFTDGPEKGQMGWDLNNFPNIQLMVKICQERLERALKQIDALERMEMDVSEKEAEMGIDEFVDMRKKIIVEFKDLIKILGKFDNIWKKIKALEKRKGIINDIQRICTKFLEGIDEANISKVYYSNKKRMITKIVDELKRLKSINEELMGYVKSEFKFEQEEYELLKQLLKGLKYDEDLLQQVRGEYEGFNNIHPHLMPEFPHLETNLNQEEQGIIINEVAPLIARLYQLTHELIQLIEEEDKKIVVFEKGAEEIQKVQRGRKRISNEHAMLATGFWNTVREIQELIEGKEGGLAQKISQLEGKIEYYIRRLKQLEEKRGTVVEKMEETLEETPILEEEPGIVKREPIELESATRGESRFRKWREKWFYK